MDFFGTLLFPLKWIIEAVLAGVHGFFTSLGLNGDGGLVWLLAILALVVVIRLAILPVVLRQRASQRKLAILAPKLNAVRAKYKGQLETAEGRAGMTAETTAIYKEAKVNPLAPFVPLAVQLVVFISLFQVLLGANQDKAGVGLLNLGLAQSFSHASLFEMIPLRDTMLANHGNTLVVVVGIAILLLMTLFQTLTQYLALTATVESGKLRDVHIAQRAILYVGPILSIVTTLAFPLVILSYWLFSNLWTTVQQYLFNRFSPLPKTPNGLPGTATEAVIEAEEEA